MALYKVASIYHVMYKKLHDTDALLPFECRFEVFWDILICHRRARAGDLRTTHLTKRRNNASKIKIHRHLFVILLIKVRNNCMKRGKWRGDSAAKPTVFYSDGIPSLTLAMISDVLAAGFFFIILLIILWALTRNQSESMNRRPVIRSESPKMLNEILL